METKICSKCKVVKSVNNYHFHRKRNRPQAYCKPCHNENQKKYRPIRLRRELKPGHKFCTQCQCERSLDNFHNNSKNPDGKNRICKVCQNSANYKSRKEHPDKGKNRWLIKQFGITLEDYNKKLQEQDNKCYICKIDAKDLPIRLAVDHCHKIGKIRDLLCTQCNMALGNVENNIEEFVKYIKKHETI